MPRTFPTCLAVFTSYALLVPSGAARAGGPPPPSAIDATFERYVQQLPAPVDLSDSNGISTECKPGQYATYNLLASAGAKLPVHGDADLPVLVKWARHSDLCIRQIALEALVPKIGFDRNKLVVPSMHDPEHYLFHDILATAKAYFDAKHVAYDPRLFDGLMISPHVGEFHARFDGTWIEDAPGKGFQEVVEITNDQVRVTTKDVPADPSWPDDTQTTEIKDIAIDDGQYVVTGRWSAESNAAGYRGDKQVPGQFVFRFWAIGEHLMWAKTGNSPYWNKFRR